ncbi:DUF2239 family protein [Novosphingobium sp.]|uniref:DUF2239 family protein n=1 Tax=Novosphingobium sp. TaxID=1874826 RepID=UPI0031D1339D
MTEDTRLAAPCAAFTQGRMIAKGPLADVAMAVNALKPEGTVLIFDSTSGAQIDVDLRGSTAEAITRLAAFQQMAPEPKKRGRPKMGVIAREITLLPRHWDWLALQPGGASQALRRLVDQARKADEGRTTLRLAHERAYRFMSALAGDYPGFEAASRALFADDMAGMEAAAADWPEDVRNHALDLARPDEDQG